MPISKKMANIIVIILLMASVMGISNVQVQSPKAQLATQQAVSGPLPAGVIANETYNPQAYLSFRPNPVGINQVILVNLWTTTPPAQDRFQLAYK